MSIVRIGLGEQKGFADGYDAIFKKKATGDAKKAKKPAPKKPAPAAKKAPAKKAPAKKK